MSTSSRIKLIAAAASVARAATRPGSPGLTERAQSVPRLVRATLGGSYSGTTKGRLGLLAAAVAYVISPLDLLPEALLPVVGAADDVVVISWALKVLIEETDRFLAWEAGRGGRWSPGNTSPVATGGSTANSVVVAPMANDTLVAKGNQGTRGTRGPVRRAATNFALETVRKRLER